MEKDAAVAWLRCGSCTANTAGVGNRNRSVGVLLQQDGKCVRVMTGSDAPFGVVDGKMRWVASRSMDRLGTRGKQEHRAR